jgi:hypothetical protein
MLNYQGKDPGIVCISFICFILLVIVRYSSDAQSRDTLQIIRGEVVLDGVIDEKAWEDITPLRPTQLRPMTGDLPSERTEIKICYDDRFFYVAGLLYDREPDKIQARSKKRDELKLNNDWFGILFDVFNDKENMLAFYANPIGLRMDMHVSKDGTGVEPHNPDWNTFWDVATKINDNGWFVEMRIPLSSLRFQTHDGVAIMGYTLVRHIARKSEWDTYPEISNEWGFWSWAKASQAKELVVKDVRSGHPFYIAPYLLGGIQQSFVLNDAESGYTGNSKFTVEPGLDIKYGLTSNLTLDLTLNTDFAQVEADDQQINLTRFSLYFPEKRQFFMERASIFEVDFGRNNQLFYSRKIGIYDGEPVRIYGGVRLVGRLGDWDLGLLSMQTAPFPEDRELDISGTQITSILGKPTAEEKEISSANNSVLRFRRQVFNENTYIGGMITSKIGTDSTYNIAYGLDGIFSFPKENYLSVAWAQSFENDLENEVFDMAPSRVRFNLTRRTYDGFGYILDYSRAGEKYNPGLGFETRSDFTRIGDAIYYGWFPGDESKFQSHTSLMNWHIHFNNEDGSLESLLIGPDHEFQTKKTAFFQAGIYYNYENVPDTFSISSTADVPNGEYSFFSLDGMYRTSMTKDYGATFSYTLGSFYDGWLVSARFSPRWTISSSLALSGTYQINRVSFPDRDQLFYGHISRIRVLYMLNTKFSITAFVQHTSAYDAVIANFRLRYNPREGTDLYIVYNDGLNVDRYREYPTLPVTNNRTVLIKYTYTFNIQK